MMFPLQTKTEMGMPAGVGMVGEVQGACWWEVWGSIPCPGTRSTSWFSQKLCFSDRTIVCPMGLGPKSMLHRRRWPWGSGAGAKEEGGWSHGVESGLALGQEEVATRAGG